MKQRKSNRRGNMKGFSFMEVMVTMFVVSVGLVTVIGLFATSFVNSAADRDRIVAAGLAQEGVELVRNVRDNSLATGDAAATGFENFPDNNNSENKNCALDYESNPLSNLDGEECKSSQSPPDSRYQLNFSSSDHRYTHANNGTTATKFFRYIWIYYDSTNTRADVVSFVYWGGTPPADIGSGNTANCTAGNKCVYSQMHLEAWR